MTASPFDAMAAGGHEELVLCHEPASGLRAVIAIHDTTLGPALGGIRQWSYASDAEAIRDALRLSQAMSYKAAVSGLDLGGGKAVVIGAPGSGGEDLFRALGRFVESLDGRYIAAEDVGTSPREIGWLSQETRWVTGRDDGDSSGDPSPLTALGVFEGMRAACEAAFGSADLAGKRVVVQGCGHVGAQLVRLLLEAGASVEAGDLDTARATALETLGARSVPIEGIVERDCDVLAPCALGGVLNAASIPRLRCAVICGAANNQLEDAACGDAVAARGIVYAPDYVVNAGGIINIFEEFAGYDAARAERQVRAINETVRRVLARAAADGISPATAADRLAQERISTARQQSPGIYNGRRREAAGHPSAGLRARH